MTETATVGSARRAAEPDISPVPDASGHFVVGAVAVAEEGGAGEAPGVAYGGRFAPEALMAALDELTAAYEQARKDPDFQAELDGLLRGYAGRPTLLYRRGTVRPAGRRLRGAAQARGPHPHRVAQDQ